MSYAFKREITWSVSRVEITPKGVTRTRKLSLRELEPLTGTFLSVFLTFFLTRVAGDQPGLFEARAKVSVEFHQGTRDAVTDRTSLSGLAAAVDVHENVEFGCGLG